MKKTFNLLISTLPGILLTIAGLHLGSGCSNSDGGKNGSGPQKGADNKLDPRERWPESGSFQYEFSFDFNGDRCTTERQQFGFKYQYCVALTDQNLNRKCALGSRKNLYRKDCGNDFEETNVAAFYLEGFDEKMQKRCKTARPPGPVFAKMNELCEFTKNENLHLGCLWDLRKLRFEQWGCSGSFSEDPRSGGPRPSPSPSPTPTPTPTPGPTPTPTPFPSMPEFVKEIEAAGIKVSVMDLGSTPGEKPFPQRLSQFWNVLKAKKDAIIARKNFISELEITSIAYYQSKEKIWILDVDLSEDQLSAYLTLFDRRVRLEQATKIHFEFGVEFQSYAPNGVFKNLQERIEYFEQNDRQLTEINELVHEIELKSYDTYWLSERSLSLRDEEFRKSFEHWQPILKEAAPLFAFFRSLDLDVIGDFDFSRYQENFLPTIRSLQLAKPQLQRLARQSFLKMINISGYNDASYYIDSQSLLVVATQGPRMNRIGEFVSAIVSLKEGSKTLGSPIEIRMDQNEEHLLECGKRMDRFLPLLRPRAKNVSRIYISDQTSYDSSSRLLFLGYADNLTDAEKVIRSIPTTN